MNENDGFRQAPVNVGDELDVKIEAVGEKGDGLARIDGFILFVPGVKEGDEVRVRVTKVLKKVGFAEVISSKDEENAIEEEQEEPMQEANGSEESDESESFEDNEDSEDFGDE